MKFADDPRFATNPARIANRIELTNAIAVAMGGRTTAHWLAVLEDAGVPCGPINTLPQVFADPHVKARGAVQTITRADGAELKLAVNPIRMSETPPGVRLAPPLLGQDTDGVLGEVLGLNEAELRRLHESSTI